MEQMDNTLNQRRQAATPPKDIPHIMLQPVEVGPVPSAEYKTIPTVQRELLTQFEDIGQNQVVLEELLEESSDVEALDPADLEWKGSVEEGLTVYNKSKEAKKNGCFFFMSTALCN